MKKIILLSIFAGLLFSNIAKAEGDAETDAAIAEAEAMAAEAMAEAEKLQGTEGQDIDVEAMEAEAEAARIEAEKLASEHEGHGTQTPDTGDHAGHGAAGESTESAQTEGTETENKEPQLAGLDDEPTKDETYAGVLLGLSTPTGMGFGVYGGKSMNDVYEGLGVEIFAFAGYAMPSELDFYSYSYLAVDALVTYNFHQYIKSYLSGLPITWKAKFGVGYNAYSASCTDAGEASSSTYFN